MKKIIIIILILLSIIAIILQLTQNNNKPQSKSKTNIPKVIVPPKSIEFTITKDKDKNINFIGRFSNSKIPKDIARLLNSNRIEHKIIINPKLSNNQEAILLVAKIITRLTDSYNNWSIIYKDNKLLISGKTTNIEDKNSIERLLELSTINSFTNIQIIEEPSIVSQLESIINSEEKKDDKTPTENEAKDILSQLQIITIQEEKHKNKKIIKIKKKTKIIKRKKIVKKKSKIKKKIEIKNKTTELTAQEYQEMLAQKQPDKNIMSLPPIKTVDMDIEQKIQKGIIPPPKTPKPLIKKETIYLPSNEKKIDDNIPWAKLYNINDNTIP